MINEVGKGETLCRPEKANEKAKLLVQVLGQLRKVEKVSPNGKLES